MKIPQKKLNYSKYIVTGLIISMVILSIDLMLPLGVAGGVPYITVILILLRSKNINLTIYAAVFCTLLTVLGYFYSPDGGEFWKVFLNRALALFAIWVTTILSLRIIQETQKEIKVLQGLLPICSSCKKIRDDKGYWSQIESYIHKHSDAEFSHGICPDCFGEKFPEIDYHQIEKSHKNI